MRQKLIPRPILLILIVAALVLPVTVVLCVGLARLLATMGDAPGSASSERIALVCGGLWVLSLICLIVVQAINSLGESDDSSEGK